MLSESQPLGFRQEGPLTLAAGASSLGGSAAGDRTHDQVRLSPRCDCIRQWGIRRLVGQVLFACEEPQQGTPLLRGRITYGSAQRWVLHLERIENGALRGRAVDPELHLSTDVGEGTQV